MPTRSPAARVRDDALGTYIERMAYEFEQSGWPGVLQLARNGGDLRPTLPDTRHPAIRLLKLLGRHGAPVLMQTPPWSPQLREERLHRGSHKSCNEHIEFLREEMLLFAKSGFWTLLPYRLVKDMPNLRLSPLGVVPQRGRRPRIIVDYSFWGVNAETVKLSPVEAMQFGRALEQLLFRIRHANPRFGPTYMAKTDLADGFYRLWLAARGIPNLGVVFPTEADEEPLVAFPLALPMGWVESPPYFCTATETVADLANAVPTNLTLPPHPLEHLADTPPPALELPPTSLDAPYGPRPIPLPVTLPSLAPLKAPVLYHDIYVDDYLSLAQGTPRRLHSTVEPYCTLWTKSFVQKTLPTLPHAKTSPLSRSFAKGTRVTPLAKSYSAGSSIRFWASLPFRHTGMSGSVQSSASSMACTGSL